MRSTLLFVLFLFVTCQVYGQSNCSDGTVYDDGVFETALGFNEVNVVRGGYGSRFDAPFYPAQVSSVCICWVHQGVDPSINFNLNVWDGSTGVPGTLLGRVTGLQADNVSSSLSTASFMRFDLSSAGIVINGPVFIGPDWNTRNDSGFFICTSTGLKPIHPTYLYGNGTDTTGIPSLNVAFGEPLLEAMGIRARFDTPTNGCVPSDTALCLNHGRFKVEASFTAPNQPTGAAHGVKLTDETGYLWFFSNTNVEVVVKVLDACGLNQKFWVYAGGLTNVQVNLTITDTKTGVIKTYANPQSKAFQPIQDTAAFATCQ